MSAFKHADCQLNRQCDLHLPVSQSVQHLFYRISPIQFPGFKYHRIFIFPFVIRLVCGIFPCLSCADFRLTVAAVQLFAFGFQQYNRPFFGKQNEIGVVIWKCIDIKPFLSRFLCQNFKAMTFFLEQDWLAWHKRSILTHSSGTAK